MPRVFIASPPPTSRVTTALSRPSRRLPQASTCPSAWLPKGFHTIPKGAALQRRIEMTDRHAKGGPVGVGVVRADGGGDRGGGGVMALEHEDHEDRPPTGEEQGTMKPKRPIAFLPVLVAEDLLRRACSLRQAESSAVE